MKYNDNIFFINGIANQKNQVFIFVEELRKIDFCSEVYIDDLQNNNKISYKIKFLLKQ